MARPAASSLAELMRMPVDKRSMEVEESTAERRNEDCADKALMFVLITDMDFLLQGFLTKLQEIQFEILLLADSVVMELT
jgi:hypothetical protein